METERKKLSMGKVMRLEEVIPYLQELTDAFKSGHITVSKSGEELLLRPRGELFLTVEAKVKKHSQRLTLEMSWGHNDSEETKEEFVILSGAHMNKEESASKAPGEVKPAADNKDKNKESKALPAAPEEIKKAEEAKK
jgi:amphi-Trp domain-containing protein